MPGSRDELIKAFEAFDVDGSGTLSANELIGILCRPGGASTMSTADAQELIASVDANGVCPTSSAPNQQPSCGFRLLILPFVV